jgi:xylan 1,4-beta-xylosidase
VIHNPVLRGFEPDPVILPVGDDFSIATVLSDEHADEFHDGQLRVLGFTGAMPGLWVQDLDGAGVPVDFTHATYRTAPDEAP